MLNMAPSPMKRVPYDDRPSHSRYAPSLQVPLASFRVDTCLPLRYAEARNMCGRDGGQMSKVKELELQIKALSAEELATFREWFARFDARAWDCQFEADVQAGKLDQAAAQALRDHAAGRSTPR
jgi:hypothetical protein